MDAQKMYFEDENLALETAEALRNNGFIVETAKDGEMIMLFAIRI